MNLEEEALTKLKDCIFFDANASHPLLPSVREQLAKSVSQNDPRLANPSSIHRKGQAARAMVAQLRDEFSQLLGRPDADEFILNSGATEGINNVIRGFAWSAHYQNKKSLLVYSQVEHSAVKATVKDVNRQLENAQVLPLSVDANGQLDNEFLLNEMEKYLDTEQGQVLLCLQIANNETGICFDLEPLLNEVQKRWGPKIEKRKKGSLTLAEQKVFILLDGAQALGKLEDSYIRRLCYLADYAAFSAHKIGGPTGIGCLWLRPGVPFQATLTGGNQERKRRAGTHNSLGALGFLTALRDWRSHGDRYRAHMAELRDYAVAQFQKIEGFYLLSPTSDLKQRTLPNTLNFTFSEIAGESLLLSLDIRGYFLSSGSACNAGTLKSSPVLEALGLDENLATNALRMSFGVENTKDDIDCFCKCLEKSLHQVRQSQKDAPHILPNIGPPRENAFDFVTSKGHSKD